MICVVQAMCYDRAVVCVSELAMEMCSLNLLRVCVSLVVRVVCYERAVTHELWSQTNVFGPKLIDMSGIILTHLLVSKLFGVLN